MEKELEQMTEEELFGFFLPKESAKDLIREYDSAYNVLRNTSERQLEKINGLEKMWVKRLMALQEIFHRFDADRTKDIKTLDSPEAACDYFDFLRHRQQEEVWVVTLDNKSHVIRKKCIAKGTIRSAVVTPREVFHVAVQDMAAALILAHNHPSGNPEPSRDDKAMTHRMAKSAKVMDIICFDHIIVGATSLSLREKYPELWRDEGTWF